MLPQTLTKLIVISLLAASSAGAFAQFDPGSPKVATNPPIATPAPTNLPAGTLALIGNTAFSPADLKPYLARLNSQQRTALATDPKKLDQFIRAFLSQRLLLEEAVSSGWDRQEANEAQLQRVRDNAIADGYLESIARPPESFPSDEEVKRAYEASLASFASPRQILVAQIFVACPANASPEQLKLGQERIEMLATYLKDPKNDFATVATNKSEDASTAARGGEVGWLTEGQIHPTLREVAINLKKGQISAPIRVDMGWLLIKINDEKPARTLSLEEVRPLVVARLREARQRTESAAYIQKLVEKQPIAIDREAIVQIVREGK